ncbi:MAG TPA: single-stranded-DNA-specific exonuclease RecJ [Methylomirabilota bacterium]|nr:single-stranded-DNA-specific exonuclease RecJ [Methylomirabilota bacterium]
MKYRWTMAPEQPALVAFLAKQLNISALLAQCLLNRGFSEPEPISRFLEPRLKNLADPFLLPNMQAAVDRLFAARVNSEPLVIFGDYDVDGVTSTALLYEFLTALGWHVNYYLPHRMDEGYGLSQAGVENCLHKFQPKVLLAVDCGSTARDQIAWLRERGVEVIVLDHHQLSDPLPAATALVNPQLRGVPGALPGFTELCSVGLAFKLAHALLKHGRSINLPGAHEFDLRPLLELVALGTIADLVPLIGENRIFVSAGLQRLTTTSRPGLVALKDVAGIKGDVGGYEVGFQLAPRLNAAGRLENAEEALRLLLARDGTEAKAIAESLNARNRERQEIERGICEQVIGAIRARFDAERDFVLVEGQLLWHIGVVGIVASRVLQEFYRPTIIIGGEGDEWRGSGRSIQGFDLAAALRECNDLLVRHGGHAMAAGLSIRADKLDAFRERMNSVARRMLKPENLQPSLRIDGEVKACDLTIPRLQELARLDQTGIGNPRVQLCLRNVGHERALQRMGADKQHAKMWITDGDRTCEAVLWNVKDGALPVGKFDLAFAPELNRYNGNVSVQLKVLDWREVE